MVVEVYRSWAPRGADRLHHLVAAHYFDNVRFHRVLLSDGVAQFGINGDTAVTAAWVTRVILDDPVTQSNARGTLTFAMRGPNTRNFQLFFNRTDNRRLDIQGFAPVGKVISGMAAVDSLYAGYGDGPPGGSDGPNQRDIASQGNAYLLKEFPKLDYIKTARFVNP